MPHLFLALLLSLPSLAEEALKPAPPILDASALEDGQNGRRATDPCENFYQFACGGWIASATIPPEKEMLLRQMSTVNDNTEILLNRILVSYAKGDYSPPAAAAPQLGRFYQSCLDTDKEGPAAEVALRQRVAEIQATPPASLAPLVAELHLSGANVFFGYGAAEDPDHSTEEIGDLVQAGLALGPRDYYFPTDAKGHDILAHYQNHVARVLELSGFPNPAKGADAVLRLETALARASYTVARQNNPGQIRHPFSLHRLARLAPHFAWAAYFRALPFGAPAKLNVDEPEFLHALSELLANTPKPDLDAYLSWQFAHSVADNVGGSLDRENFDFWRKFMGGVAQPKPRWRLCTDAAAGQLGYALAEAYAKTLDGGSIRAQTEHFLDEIKNAFRSDLRSLPWMDLATRQAALAKVNAIRQKIGGPEKWRNYSSLLLVPDNYLANALAATRFEARRDLAKIGHPADRSEWLMMPWEINAYYVRPLNEFVFPYGTLQPPILDARASHGANLGTLGGLTIGHELTHGFDNNGAQYDARGNVRNWWSKATLRMFREKTACYSRQASAYYVPPVNLPVNGENTLEENLADQGGVKLGYRALEEELAHRAPAPPWNTRYDERQQYWIAMAQSWCTKQQDDSLRQQITVDTHPPDEFRVNGVVMNLPEFAKDFACHEGARMAPVKRCSLW